MTYEQYAGAASMGLGVTQIVLAVAVFVTSGIAASTDLDTGRDFSVFGAFFVRHLINSRCPAYFMFQENVWFQWIIAGSFCIAAAKRKTAGFVRKFFYHAHIHFLHLYSCTS